MAPLQVGKKLLLLNILNTCRRCSKCCTLGLLYTKISSKCTTSKFSIKYINHNSHKSVKHIRKINFHNHPYIKVVPCLKGGFPFISPPHLNLLIGSTKISVRKDSGTWSSLRILSRCGIGKQYLMLILFTLPLSTHSPCSVFVWYKGWDYTWTHALFHQAF